MNNTFWQIAYIDELRHHGILGQRWGIRNGTSYPLNPNQYSSAERRAAKLNGTRESAKVILRKTKSGTEKVTQNSKARRKEKEDERQLVKTVNKANKIMSEYNKKSRETMTYVNDILGENQQKAASKYKDEVTKLASYTKYVSANKQLDECNEKLNDIISKNNGSIHFHNEALKKEFDKALEDYTSADEYQYKALNEYINDVYQIAEKHTKEMNSALVKDIDKKSETIDLEKFIEKNKSLSEKHIGYGAWTPTNIIRLLDKGDKEK